MGQMHGSNGFSCRRFFQECVDRFLMQAGLEKVLKFREGLIQIGSKLDFQPGSLFDRFLTETPQFFEVHHSIEGYGFQIYELAKAAGIKYNNGENTVTFFGGLLLGK